MKVTMDFKVESIETRSFDIDEKEFFEENGIQLSDSTGEQVKEYLEEGYFDYTVDETHIHWEEAKPTTFELLK